MVKGPSIVELTKYYKSGFYRIDQPVIEEEKLPLPLITEHEVAAHVNKLKNRRATGADGVKSEDLKALPVKTVTDNLNQLIQNRDTSLTHGLIAPVQKPNKNSMEAASYRPIGLLSAYRKLLSKIILARVNKDLDAFISPNQHAYAVGKSTSDVVLIHKMMIASCIERNLELKIIGIDMSKAFDTVNRCSLLSALKSFNTPENHLLITSLSNKTSLAVKFKKEIGESFCTNIGVHQGDALSPRLFNFYLQMALNEVDLGRKVPVEHDYAIPASTNLLPHVEYADDVDFICKPNENSEELLTLVETSFAKYQLRLNTDKTEISFFGAENHNIAKIKKLGSFLDDIEDIENRNRLCWIALGK